MNPEQPNTYINPTEPQPVQPVNTPAPVDPNVYIPPGAGPNIGNPQLPQDEPKKKSNKLLFIIAGAAVGVLLLIIIVVIALSGSKTPVPTKTTQDTTDNNQSQSLEPASAIGVEHINESIGQDIGNLNDEQDLPPTKLDDKALGL